MIVDASALVTIAIDEPGCEMLLQALSRSRISRISAANLFEAWMVVDRRRIPGSSAVLDDTIRKAALIIEPVTLAQVHIAREAYAQYGKGSGHPAKLNFGDCFAYALAKQSGEPLLFVGNDFVHTDLESAIAR